MDEKIIVLPSYDFTLAQTLIPALENHSEKEIYVYEDIAPKIWNNEKIKKLSSEEFKQMIQEPNIKFLFTLEERSKDIIDQNVDVPALRTLKKFKDKILFRKLVKKIPGYDDIWFDSVTKEDLKNIKYPGRPFVIQVAVGFGSKGVEIVRTESELKQAIENAIKSAEQGEEIFSKAVVDSNNWVLCEFFNGDEYAVDAFIMDDGEPVITGIYCHPFKDENDVSDRVYYTSKKIMSKFLLTTEFFLKEMVKNPEMQELKGLMLHLEFRFNPEKDKHIMPIELNLNRFGGYGLAQLPKFAFGFNSYDKFFKQEKINWQEILDKIDEETIFYWVLAIAPENDNALNIDVEKFKKEFKEGQFQDIVLVNKSIVAANAYAITNDYQDIREWLEKDFPSTIMKNNKISNEDAKQILQEYPIAKHMRLAKANSGKGIEDYYLKREELIKQIINE